MARAIAVLLSTCAALGVLWVAPAVAGSMRAGVAKVDITDRTAGPVNDPLFVKALVLENDDARVVLITLDAVAIAEIGTIPNSYLGDVRARLGKELGIAPASVLVNASHCHGVVCKEVVERTLEAVTQAAQNMVPVKIGSGVGHEDRIMENRRLKMKDGREVDVRHAYSLPPDDEVAAVGPVDPEIGVLRIDRVEGETLAVVYNFACHPIQSVPSGGNTADMTGFASRVIEENLDEGAIALFVQGCGGDINPIWYKDVDHPRDGEPQGNLLGLSTLRAVRKIECREDDRLTIRNEVLEMPRANTAERIIALESETERLLGSLAGTHLNLKTFLPLAVKYGLEDEFPSYASHRYLRDDAAGRDDLRKLDATNRAHLKQYIHNVHVMEELTRIQTNLALLRKHQATNLAASKRTLEAELVGLRVGDFVLLAFPGELVVQIGLNLKQASPHEHTFVAGYSNGYLYYAPTTEQLLNSGAAQEDSECLMAPEWQKQFETKAVEMLGQL